MTGQRDDKLCSVSIQHNTYISAADDYNYAMKSDFMLYHQPEKRQ